MKLLTTAIMVVVYTTLRAKTQITGHVKERHLYVSLYCGCLFNGSVLFKVWLRVSCRTSNYLKLLLS